MRIRSVFHLFLSLLALAVASCGSGAKQQSAYAFGDGYGRDPGSMPPYGTSVRPPSPNPYAPSLEMVSATARNPLPYELSSNAPLGRASSVLLMDANTGRILAGRSLDTPRPIASTQKLLTALIIAESGDLDRYVTVQSGDTRVEPTKVGLSPGERYTRRQLLTALLVKSCNDIAMALARDNAGSVQAFAYRMNARARQLGATNSYFVNPHGLPAPGQRSTARDLGKIAMQALRNPVIRPIVRMRSYTFRHATSGRVTTLKNTNDLLKEMPECIGMKTGYTNAAGRCLVSAATSRGRTVIAVQLGTRTKYIWDDGAALMRWGLNR